MNRRKKKAWKAVPQLSPYDKGRALDIEGLIKREQNSLKVTIASGLGSHSYTYHDIAHFYEMSHRPFNQTVSLFKLKGESNEKYARTRVV